MKFLPKLLYIFNIDLIKISENLLIEINKLILKFTLKRKDTKRNSVLFKVNSGNHQGDGAENGSSICRDMLTCYSISSTLRIHGKSRVIKIVWY